MRPSRRYRPAAFFTLTFAFSWIAWLVSAWLSYRPGQQTASQLFAAFGLLGPFATAYILLRGSPALWRDFKRRLIDPRLFDWRFLPVTVLLMPAATYLAIWLSVKLGRPAGQLALVPNLAAMVPLMFLAPLFEELGWRGYGVDALRARFGMGGTTALFAALWALWHWPLFLIDHTYQHDVWLASPVYVANFFVSVLPAAVIANWLYYKHNRSIAAAVLFHFMLDAVAESFNAEQFAKCIVTGVFLIAAALIVIVDRKAFAREPKGFVASERTAPA